MNMSMWFVNFWDRDISFEVKSLLTSISENLALTITNAGLDKIPI